MQIPLIILHEVCGVSYRDLFEAFLDTRAERFPTVAEIKQFFNEKARDIQAGGAEYCHSAEWLDIYWPADEYMLIKLCAEERLDAFYREAERCIRASLAARFLSVPDGLLRDAVELNRRLMKVPFQTEDLELELSYNVWEFYRAVLRGLPRVLEHRPSRYHIERTSRRWTSWDDWCREVIWWGNKKGAYLYGNEPLGPELAGHF